MPKSNERIDPFGAPEFFCDDAQFEVAAEGVARVYMTLEENGETVVKAKLLIPFKRLPKCIASATSFAAGQMLKRAVIDGAEPVRVN